MEQELKAGDVVQLKSGGPDMTVEIIGAFGFGSSHTQAKCVWFDGKKRYDDLFELTSLKKK